MWTEENLYCQCGRPATWVRHTQFAGSHPFCSEHARQEADFGEGDPSYFFWKELRADQIAQKHKTAVDGYEGRLKLLCERVHLMRYDKVEKFYGYTETELRRQATNDRAKGRTQLADLLEDAANAARQQQERFGRIWALCEPHMGLDKDREAFSPEEVAIAERIGLDSEDE